MIFRNNILCKWMLNFFLALGSYTHWDQIVQTVKKKIFFSHHIQKKKKRKNQFELFDPSVCRILDKSQMNWI